MATPATPSEPGRANTQDFEKLYERVERFWNVGKTIASINAGIAAAFLGFVFIFSDVFYFFWSLIAVTLIALAITVYFWFFGYRPSELAADVNVRRFGRGTRIVSAAISGALCALTVVILVVFWPAIFSSVVTEMNESPALVQESGRSVRTSSFLVP
jgi:hypothetical protein